jgi:hypothetical protein
MTINDLTPFSGTTPDKDAQTAENFDTNVQNWVNFTVDLPDEINTFIDELSAEINSFAINIAGATATVSIYAAGTTYDAGNQVLDPADNYRMYTSQQGSNTGNTPSSDDGTYWRLTFGQGAGATTTSSATDITLTTASDQAQSIAMTASEKFVNLPDATTLYEGADTYMFINTGDYRFGVKDSTGTFICSIAAKGSGRCSLVDNSTSAGIWKASDGADLMMNRMKTVCNADASTNGISACKLTSTEVFVAWCGANNDGFCAVLTWDSATPEITVSNILEFDTTEATRMSCCRMTDTVAIVGYRDTDSDGQCCAITYDGTDTLTVTNTHEFSDANTINYLQVLPIHEDGSTGKIGVFYDDASGYPRVQVLNWTGTEITANTAETGIFTGAAVAYLSATLLSGAVGAASMVVGYVVSNTLYTKHVSWNGTTLTPHLTAVNNGTSIQSASVTYNTIVALDSSYVVAFAHYYGTVADYNEIKAYLLYWDSSSIAIKKEIKISGSKDGYVFDQNAAFLIDSETVGFVCDPTLNGYSTMYKIKAAGSTNSRECVLFVESKIPLGKSHPSTDNRTAINFDSAGAVFLYADRELATNYLAAQRIDIGA